MGELDGELSQLFYCSKCTIPLVQQGFIVEEIGKDMIGGFFQHPEAMKLGEYRSGLENIKKNAEFVVIQMRQKEEE